MNEYIKSDLMRYCGDTSAKTFLRCYLGNRVFRFQVALRLRSQGSVLGKILWKLNQSRKLIGIEPETKIGYGLYIGHYGSLVVNPTAVLGNNCNLSQGITIGANEGQAAVIGDDVYIGPNVCIVEAVTIGSRATIGAGSIVTKDIPENATAAGNYAKVLNFRNPARYICNRYEP